jgi:hypothetical protein
MSLSGFFCQPVDRTTGCYEVTLLMTRVERLVSSRAAIPREEQWQGTKRGEVSVSLRDDVDSA